MFIINSTFLYLYRRHGAHPPQPAAVHPLRNVRNYSFAFSFIAVVAATVASHRVVAWRAHSPLRSTYYFYYKYWWWGGQSASNVAMATATFPPRGHGNDRRKRLPILCATARPNWELLSRHRRRCICICVGGGGGLFALVM